MSRNFFKIGEKRFYHPKELYFYLVENCQSLRYDYSFGKKDLISYNQGKTEYYFIETKFPFRGKFSVEGQFGFNNVLQLFITSHGAIFLIIRYLHGVYPNYIVDHFPPHERFLRHALLNKYNVPVKFTFEKCFYNGSEIENFSSVKTKYITIDFHGMAMNTCFDGDLILNDVEEMKGKKNDELMCPWSNSRYKYSWILNVSGEFKHQIVLLPDEKSDAKKFEVEFKTVYYFEIGGKYFLDRRNWTDRHFNFNEKILFVLRGNKKIDVIDIAQKVATPQKLAAEKYLVEVSSLEKIAEIQLD
jgi:hypothetical protein